jgi:SAM-dependent methyltransferase
MDEADPGAARICLANLVRINRTFGGHAVLRKLLARVSCTSESFSFLDVGAASGDSAQIIQEAFPRSRVVSLDQNAVHLESAPRPKVLADAFHLPFASRSFDYVFSSLFLHHFENEQIVLLLRRFAEIARKGVLISDLERHIVPYLFLPTTRWLFKWHWIAVHDGKLSVRAALNAAELATLACRAGLRNVDVVAHRPAFRLSLVGAVS